MRPFVTALLLVSTSTLAQSVTYRYTSLDSKDCRTISLDERTESIEQLCPGLGGYQLLLQEGDLRQNIVVIRGRARTSLDLWTVVGSNFSYLGPRAEWRSRRGAPFALILRYNLSNPDDASKVTSWLTVAKLGARPCVVANIPPGPRQNELARAAADTSATRACLPS